MRLSNWLLPAPGSRGLDTAEEAYQMAGRLGDDVRRTRAAMACGVALRASDPQRVLAYADEALAGREYSDIAFDGVYHPMYLRAEARLALGDLEGADSDLRAAFALMATRYPERLVWGLPVWERARALLEGRLADAARYADDLDAWPGGQRIRASGRPWVATTSPTSGATGRPRPSVRPTPTRSSR